MRNDGPGHLIRDAGVLRRVRNDVPVAAVPMHRPRNERWTRVMGGPAGVPVAPPAPHHGWMFRPACPDRTGSGHRQRLAGPSARPTRQSRFDRTWEAPMA